MKNKLKAFTLVELLVAMAIFAVLVALAIGGVTIAQRAARDAQRRDAMKTIGLNIANLYSSSSQFPTTITGNATGATPGGTLTMTSGSLTGTVQLTGPAILALTTQVGSGTGGTKYCYGTTTSGYVLGALMEDGIWDFSLSATDNKPANSVTQASGCTSIVRI